MIQTAYLGKQRIHISEYDPKIHTANEIPLTCAFGHPVIAKRGEIRKHHYCHVTKANCYGGDMTDWHVWWQARIKPIFCEKRFKMDVLKIADATNVIGDTLHIIEFQNSKMSKEEMAFREKFYTRTDLLRDKGVPFCKASLTWVFNLSECDIEIDHIFGDIICFRWIKGSKFMYPAKARTLYDFGKRELVEVHSKHKPKIRETKFVGRIMPISLLDSTLFAGTLRELTDEQKRTVVHQIGNYSLMRDEIRCKVISMVEKFYYEKKGSKEVLENIIGK